VPDRLARAIYFSLVMKSARDSDKPSRDRIDAIDLTEDITAPFPSRLLDQRGFEDLSTILSLLDSRGNAFSRDALDAL